MVGLLVVMGGVGGIESSPDNMSMFWSTLVTMIGLGLMWINVRDLDYAE